MSLPTTDTTVTYPDGATTSTGTVLHVEPLSDGRSAVLLDTTAFHPVDTAWPDQPSDRGTITTTAGTQPVVDGVTGGILDGELHLGANLPVRTGTEGWTFVVAHIIEGPPPAVGESAQIDVDQDHRAAQGTVHTFFCPMQPTHAPHAHASSLTRCSRTSPRVATTTTSQIGDHAKAKPGGARCGQNDETSVIGA